MVDRQTLFSFECEADLLRTAPECSVVLQIFVAAYFTRTECEEGKTGQVSSFCGRVTKSEYQILCLVS